MQGIAGPGVIEGSQLEGTNAPYLARVPTGDGLLLNPTHVDDYDVEVWELPTHGPRTRIYQRTEIENTGADQVVFGDGTTAGLLTTWGWSKDSVGYNVRLIFDQLDLLDAEDVFRGGNAYLTILSFEPTAGAPWLATQVCRVKFLATIEGAVTV